MREKNFAATKRSGSSPLTTDEIKALRDKIRPRPGSRGDFRVEISQEEALYLCHLIGSHIKWREWLIPED